MTTIYHNQPKKKFSSALEYVSEILHPICGNFARISATLLRVEILFRHLPKRTIEHRNVMLHAKPCASGKTRCGRKLESDASRKLTFLASR